VSEKLYTPDEVQEIAFLRLARKQALWDHYMAKTEKGKQTALKDIRKTTHRLYELTQHPAYSWSAR
tara:strand:- start:719 stop:916 length:198 start_codon:yes stop_codon:yes gene_type:complete